MDLKVILFFILIVFSTVLSADRKAYYQKVITNDCVTDRTKIAFSQDDIGGEDIKRYKSNGDSDDGCLIYRKLAQKSQDRVELKPGSKMFVLPSSNGLHCGVAGPGTVGRLLHGPGSGNNYHYIRVNSDLCNGLAAVHKNNYMRMRRDHPNKNDINRQLAEDIYSPHSTALKEKAEDVYKRQRKSFFLWVDNVLGIDPDKVTEGGFCFSCEKKRRTPMDDFLVIQQADMNMKNSKELKSYICSYLKRNLKRNKKKAREICSNFKNIYFPLSEIASKYFSGGEIDARYANCLLLQESGGRGNAVSQTGATGLGQHTSINRREISNRINKNPTKKRWNSFLKKARKHMREKGFAEPSHCSANNDFKTRKDASCPSKSIAATFIYQEIIRKIFADVLKKKNEKIIWAADNIKLYRGMAGGHNGGETLTRRVVKGNIEEWLEQLARGVESLKKGDCPKVRKVFEATQQMVGVSRCLTEGDKRAPHGISSELLSKELGRHGPGFLKRYRACK